MLVALKTQPIRGILPVTLKEGKDQTQSGELPENDDNWARLLVHSGQETLKQHLARTLVQGTEIDSPASVEHTEWVEPEMVLGSITLFASDKHETA